MTFSDQCLHSLPPGVVGEQRGALSLAVDEIVWVGEVVGSARLRAEWWGSNKEEQVIFAPVDVRNFSMCVPGGLMHQTYSVHTGREKFGEYLSDASPLVLRLVDGVGKAEVELSMGGVEGYFPVVGEGDEEIANVHIRVSYKDIAEMMTEAEEISKKPVTRPLLRSRKQRQPGLVTKQTLPSLPKITAPPSPTRNTSVISKSSPMKTQRTSKVTFSALPETLSMPAPTGTPIADSLIASLLDQSANLRASMREQLELTQLELDRKGLEEDLDDKENNPVSENDQNLPLHQATGWNLPVARLKQLAQLKSLTTTVVSLSIQPFLLSKLKQPARTRPSFVPTSSGKREQSNPTRQQNNISLFIKFCLPGRKENNFCSRRLVGDVAEFGESALEQIKCDTNLLDSWWGTSMVFTVFCRQVGQKDSIQLGSASIGLKHLLSGDTSLGDGRTVSLPVYSAQGLFRQLQVPKEERREVVGTVCVGFSLGCVGPRTSVRSRTVSPQDPVRETSTGTQDRVEVKRLVSGTRRSPALQSPPSGGSPPAEKVTLHSQPSTTLHIRHPVFVLLSVQPRPGLPSYSSLSVRWWGGREVQGRVLDSVEQVLVPGEEGRIFNRQSVSRMLESCLVVEVWSEDNLVGIARVPTDKLARNLKQWKEEMVEGARGEVEVVGLIGGNIVGLLSVDLIAGTEVQLEELVGREKMRTMLDPVVVESQVGSKVEDKETMTVELEDRETMTDWENDEVMEHGKDIIEILTDGYDTPDSDSDTEAAEDVTDQTAVHSGSSLIEHPTVVEPPINTENFKVEITVEEGRVMANYSWLYCTLPSGQPTKVSQSSFPCWHLTSQTSLPLEYLTDSHTQLIIRVWSSLTETPEPDQDQMVGFAAIDLSPLLSFPLLSGWYNISNWLGKCRGQLKVTVKPLELIPPVTDHRQSPPKTVQGSVHVQSFVPGVEEDIPCYLARGAYSHFPSHLVSHTEQIITQSNNKERNTKPLWNPPTTNFLPPDPTRSFLETSLARKLSELDLISARMMSGGQSDTSSSQDSVNDLTFIVEESDDHVPNILSLSMVNSTINTQLASLRSLSCPDTDHPRPDCQQLPLPSLHLELEALNLEDSLEGQVTSDRSRVAPEGGNTDG